MATVTTISLSEVLKKQALSADAMRALEGHVLENETQRNTFVRNNPASADLSQATIEQAALASSEQAILENRRNSRQRDGYSAQAQQIADISDESIEAQVFARLEEEINLLDTSVNRYHPGDAFYEDNPVWIERAYNWLKTVMNALEEPGELSNFIGGQVSNGKLYSFALWQTALHAMNPQLGMGKVWGGVATLPLAALSNEIVPGTIPLAADTALKQIGNATGSPEATLANFTETDFASAVVLEPVVDDETYGSKKFRIAQQGFAGFITSSINTAVARAGTDSNAPSTWLQPTASGDKRVVYYSDGVSNQAKKLRKRAAKMDAAFKFAIGNGRNDIVSDVETGIMRIGELAEDSFREAIDDEAYLPFYFKDMRTTGGSHRHLAFRAFIDSIGDRFSPGVSSEQYYGRTDPVLISDSSVSRTIAVRFKMVAYSPNDLDVIYKKQAWLTSLIYNEYAQIKGGAYALAKAPLVEMRIGDLICAYDKRIESDQTIFNGGDTNGDFVRANKAAAPAIGQNRARAVSEAKSKYKKGILGKITQLSFDYGEGKYTWETTKGSQVPLIIDVSLEFAVSHAEPIRVVSGNFESRTLCGIGWTQDPDQPPITTVNTAQPAASRGG